MTSLGGWYYNQRLTGLRERKRGPRLSLPPSAKLHGGAQCNRIIDFRRLLATALRRAASAAFRRKDVNSGKALQSAASDDSWGLVEHAPGDATHSDGFDAGGDGGEGGSTP